MEITLNGQTVQTNANSVLELIEKLKLEANHLVVEMNGTILKRDQWASSAISDGDIIELIQFVAGG